MIIPVWLDGDSRAGRVEYAMDLLLGGLGHRAVRVHDPALAVVHYSAGAVPGSAPGSVWIRAEGPNDWDGPAPLPTLLTIARAVRAHGGPAGLAHSVPDVLYAAYAVVTGALEATLPRDEVGVPRFREAPAELRELLDRPLVAECAELLGARLASLHPESVAHRVPRWPGGKRSVVLVSHDVDAPFVRPDAAFYLRRAARGVAHYGPRRAAVDVLAAGKSAALRALGRRPSPDADPNLCFQAWREVEASLGARSCHYVAVTTSAQRGAAYQDVAYDFRHPTIVREVKALMDAGWEIGLHASINARVEPARLAEEKALLERVVGPRTIVGVRHHWWALDRDRPERTFRAHAAAGLGYDSSLGANDAVVFRRGMIWPFHPFDREHDAPCATLQLPPTLMDGAIFYYDHDAADGDARILAHLRTVAAAGGMAVLDWHLEQLNPQRLRGAGASVARALTAFAGETDVLWALPRDIHAWWGEREARRAALQRRLEPTRSRDAN